MDFANMTTYQMIKDVIDRDRGLKLDPTLKMIAYYHIKGEISDDQLVELQALAREKIGSAIDDSVQRALDDIKGELTAIKARLDALEAQTPAPEPPEEDVAAQIAAKYPPFKAPSLFTPRYKKGDGCKYNEKYYECAAEETIHSPFGKPSDWTDVTDEVLAQLNGH